MGANRMQEDAPETGSERTIEQAFARLEEITARLEDPGTSLEESFALYTEGSELLNWTNDRIDTVEKKLQILQARQSGEADGRTEADPGWSE